MVLKIEQLRVAFRGTHGRYDVAVEGVDLELAAGEAVGIVGESASGKSTVARALMGLLPGSADVKGRIEVNGVDIRTCSSRQLRSLRGSAISYIFQDATAALDPLRRIGSQIAEAFSAHGRDASREGLLSLLEAVGMPTPTRQIDQYPHQLSGGLRQRAMIAIAVANRPQILIADEPTTSLDVSSEARILELLKQIQSELGMAMIFISHDIRTVERRCDRVVVLYAGQVMEQGPIAEVFQRPKHHYTVGLMNASPHLTGAVREALIPIPGDPPTSNAKPVGCPFHPRCQAATDECMATRPPLVEVGDGHLHACVNPSTDSLPNVSRSK